jgi:hypothetical protein
MSDEAKIQELAGRAWHEGRSIDMGHLAERDRMLVWQTIADLIEAHLPHRKTRLGHRQYVLIVRDHHHLHIEFREL